MENSRSKQFKNQTSTPAAPKPSKPLNYGYGGVNQLLTMQIKQEQLTELRKKNQQN